MLRLIFIAIYCLTCCLSPALAEATSHANDIEEITRAILRKQIELEKLNTHFRVETTLVSPWRQRRMFLYGESNASLVASGLITVLPVRYNLARKKVPMPPVDNKNRTRTAAATRLQLVGQAIGAGGDVAELSLNLMNYFLLRKKGFNPASYCKQVKAIHAQLDSLLEQRALVINNATQLSANEIKITQTEGKLLNDLRDLSLLEYQQYLSSTRRFWAFQNTAYLVDFAKNATGMAGSLVSLAANHQRRRHWVGAAYLLSTISGAIVMVTPVVGRVTGNVAGLAAARTASKGLLHIQATDATYYLSDKEKFLNLVAATSANTPYLNQVNKRRQYYEQQGELFISQEQFLKRQRQQARGTLKENILFAAGVAPPRIANGVTGMIGAWHYYNNSPDRNRMFAAGNTAYLAGTTFNMLETARVQASIELSNKKLARSHLLPRQQFEHRLAILDEMDQSLIK